MFGGLDYDSAAFLERHLVVVGRHHLEEGRHGRVDAAWRSVDGRLPRISCGCSVAPNHVAPDRSTDGFVNDVWVSDDGLHWTRGDERRGHGRRGRIRAWSSSTTSCTSSAGEGHTDVWRTSDGKDWTRLAAQARWRPRSVRPVVFDGKLWVFGGYIGDVRPTP